MAESTEQDGHNEAAAAEYAQKTAYFEANDGYLINVNITKVLNGMGFPPVCFSESDSRYRICLYFQVK